MKHVGLRVDDKTQERIEELQKAYGAASTSHLIRILVNTAWTDMYGTKREYSIPEPISNK